MRVRAARRTRTLVKDIAVLPLLRSRRFEGYTDVLRSAGLWGRTLGKRPPVGFARSEADGGRRLLALGSVVEIAGVDAGNSSEEQPRNGAHHRVLLRGRVVVELAGERELVFGVGERRLQLLEVHGGLE